MHNNRSWLPGLCLSNLLLYACHEHSSVANPLGFEELHRHRSVVCFNRGKHTCKTMFLFHSQPQLPAKCKYLAAKFVVIDLAGWGYKTSAVYSVGAGVGGSNATCVNVATQASYNETGPGGGGLGFTSQNGTNAGYQPFAGKTTLDFWIKSNSTGPGDASEAGFSKGSVPDVNVYLSNAEAKLYCGASLELRSQTPVGTQATTNGGTYYHFHIPFASFNCAGGSAGSLANIDSIGFGSNSNADYASFCLDELVLA